MIEQQGNAVKFLAFYVESKVGKTGLTVTVDIYDPSGTKIVDNASATEVGGGLYSYTLSSGSVDENGEFVAVFKTATTSVDAQHIPALWVIGRAGIENLDATVASVKAKTDLIPGTIDGKTFAEIVMLVAAVLLGKASGLETTSAQYRAINDSKTRVTATVDGDGNRTAVTLDPS